MENKSSTRSHSDPSPFEALFPWSRAVRTLRAIWPQLVYISLLSMSIPQYLLFCVSTEKAAVMGPELAVKQQLSLDKSMAILQQFGGAYLGQLLITGLCFLVGLFTALALCHQSIRNEEPSLGRALRLALKTLLPRGLLFFTLLALLSLLGLVSGFLTLPGAQMLLLIFSVLMTALPAEMLNWPRSPFTAFASSLKMHYAKAAEVSRWSCFFVLMTYQLVAMNLFSLVAWLHRFVSELDIKLGVARSVFYAPTESFPFGKWIYFTELVYALGLPLVAMLFAIFVGSYVYDLHRRASVGQTIHQSV